jgi:Tol biopolymer transport system component
MKRYFVVSLVALCVGAVCIPAAAIAATPGNLAYVSNSDGPDTDIFTISSASPGGTPAQLTFNTAVDKDPTWSPDGRRIAFLSDRAVAGDEQIWVMNADGSGATQLTFSDAEPYAIDWSPDGSRIVLSLTPGSTNNIWQVNPDGTGLAQLSTYVGPGGPYGPNFSPDGTRLVLMAYTGPTQPLGLMSSAGGVPTPIPNTPLDSFAPDFTADGKRIVFFSDDFPGAGTDDEIFSITPTGTDIRQLTNNGGAGASDAAPRASRDGLNRIAFRSNSGGDNEIWVMNADGSGPIQLTNNAFNDRSPDWQPNVKCGKGIATIVGTSASETLTGGPGPDVMSGQGGKDKIKGLGGKDIICGDKGKDNLNGGKGKDKLYGGKGKDKIVGGKGKDKCVGGKGDDSGKGCEKEKSL